MKDANDILTCYLRVGQRMSQQFRSHFGKLNLTFPQALVLSVLDSEGQVPISTLAECTGSANSTVSGIVDRLEKLGLAKRERSAADRRVIYVTATPQYEELRDKAQTSVGDYFSSLLATIPAEKRELVLQGLKCLDEALGQES